MYKRQVVDTDVTTPWIPNFYLFGHSGIQGTSRPTKYSIIRDDSEASMDSVQSFMFALTHSYQRCSRSVSLPTPIYYAHLAAARSNLHMTQKFTQYADQRSAASYNSIDSDTITFEYNDLHPNMKGDVDANNFVMYYS